MTPTAWSRRDTAAMAAAILAAASAGFAATPADARIRCDGNYQIVNGSPIATPYCQDENLARVAREYGMRVTGAQIRRSESKKAQACRLVGHDNRVSVACAAYRIDPDFKRKF